MSCCHTNALRHDQQPFPVACVLDHPRPGFCDSVDSFFSDNGQEVTQEELGRLCPYTGPRWYPRQAALMFLDLEVVTAADCKAHFQASAHAPSDPLRGV
jgi:hypothetical protein